MAIYHILLFKTNPAVQGDELEEFFRCAKRLGKEVPGVQTVRGGLALPVTAFAAKGFDAGIIMVLEKEEDLEVLRTHPTHDLVSKLAGECMLDKLVIDVGK